MENDLALFQHGRLSDAIESVSRNVKNDQSNISMRSRLVEYLCVASKFDRADKQLNIIASQDPKTSLRVMELRQIIRASIARNQVFSEGRIPEFISKPPEHLKNRLKALVCLREGDLSESAQWLIKAEKTRPTVSGSMRDIHFDDLRDLDDFYGGVLEVLTTTGKYMWVPLERILEINFVTSKKPIDSAWREAELIIKSGPTGVVYVPALYPSENEITNNEAISIGLETKWIENDRGITRGVGLKTFMVGDESFTMHELTEIRFE